LTAVPERASPKAGLSLAAYRIATRAIGPFIPYLLAARMRRGKEEEQRLPERIGIPSLDRPEGMLVWIHAASVGESLSVLPLIAKLIAARRDLHVLMTTGTVTSAHLMRERLPQGAFHQFVALDHPDYTARFLDHWKPDLAIWVESEFWPNLIVGAHARGIPLALVNARITEKSYRGWQRFPSLIADLLGRFSLVTAQDRASATRLEALGARDVSLFGNLKHEAEPLAADESELAALRLAMGTRPVWLATNTHEGEEAVAAAVHAALAPSHPGLLTLIVPRHPARGPAIAAELRRQGLTVALRSERTPISASTDVYVADTLGELGLFYRLAKIVFVGGTLAEVGGHNPFEAARLGAALIAGPVDFNFAEAYQAFEAADALARISDAAALGREVGKLLDDTALREKRGAAAEQLASQSNGAATRTADALLALLPAERMQGGRHAHA
jgi:3-deoxy-D-manno-octulosonic-acid transferase